MQKSQPKAIPFILSSQKGFYLTQQATAFLKGLTCHVGVVSIVGKYRTGKSLFVNRVLINEKNAFIVGPTVNPCTKGLWLWSQTIKSQNPEFPDSQVLIVDTQGFGGTDQNSNNDNHILLFSLLLSSFFIYNSVGSIDENSLNNLSLIINLAKQIQSKLGDQVGTFFPYFLWIVRDFSLQMVDRQGCPINSKQYLEKALEMQKGVSETVQNKNKMRRLFTMFFKERDCATLVRPVQTEESLQKLDSLEQSQLRPQFVQQIKSLRKKIYRRVKPKKMQDKLLTGPMLIQLATVYIQAINNGSLPSIKLAWSYVRRRESEKAQQAALQKIKQKLDMIKTKISIQQLKNLQNTLNQQLIQTFKKYAIGCQSQLRQYKISLNQKFKSFIQQFKYINLNKWYHYYQSIIQQLSFDFKKNFDSHLIQTAADYKKSITILKQQFLSKTIQGPGKKQYLKDMEIKYSNQYLIKLVSTSHLKYQKQIEFSHIKSQHLQQQLKLQKSQIKQIQQKLWHTQRQLNQITQQLSHHTIKSQHNILFYKNQIQKIQSQLNIQKGQQQRLLRQNDFFKKLLQDNKLRIQNLNSRLSQSQISRKQLIQQNKIHLRQLQNLQYHLLCRDQQLSKIKKQIYKSNQSLDKYRLKQQKINTLFSQTKSSLQNKQKQFLQLNLSYHLLHKQHQSLISKFNNLQTQSINYQQQYSLQHKSNLSIIQSLKNNLQSQINSKIQLSQTNKNLSSALSKIQLRTKQSQQKIETLKQYKNAIKNASCLQCKHCNKFIACPIFTQHLNICNNSHSNTLTQSTTLPSKPLITQPSAPLPIEINITQTLVRQSDNKPYTEYVISLSKGGAKWEITRKYKEFCELHNMLRIALPGANLSEASYVVNPQEGNRKSLLIQQRRKMLEKYLRDISQNSFVARQQCYLSFMEMPKQNDQLFGIDQSLLPQSPQQFLKSWNQRNIRMKQTSNRRMFNSNTRK